MGRPSSSPLAAVTLAIAAAAAATIGGCHAGPEAEDAQPMALPPDEPFVVVLGIAQDAGFPQAACRKVCCAEAWGDPSRRRHPASLAIVDPEAGRFVIDCTPDFPEQLRLLDAVAPPSGGGVALDGVLLTHAHIGHYTGLVHLGREVTGSQGVPVWAMPRMAAFLREAGPWSQLVELENVVLRPLVDGEAVPLTGRITATPFLVPHRDELSETVGFRIEGPRRSVVWLPDIDKWDRWGTPIEDVIAGADLAYLDATFFADGEIPGRPMELIPHPFVSESIARFASLSATERAKVRFVHLNHTNPALDPDSEAAGHIRAAGHRVAIQGEREPL